MNQWMDCYAPLIGRILVGGYFLWNGIIKALGFTMVSSYVASAGLPYPVEATTVAVLVESVLGIMLITGYGARLAAMGLALWTLLVTGIFHIDLGDQMQQTLFLKNIALVGGLLYITAYGAGSWVVKRRRR